MNESPSSRKPNSSLDHSTISAPEPRQVHRADRRRAQVVEHEVAVGDGVERVLDDAVEAELARDRVAAACPS